MQYIDIFNGDADGIFSLIQWRKAYPVAADKQLLITGVKRDNGLVKKVTNEQATDAVITILDISFDKNTDDVARVLKYSDKVFYCDHHQAETLFSHPKLESNINFASTVCTGLLVSEQLGRKYHLWAIAAAFGDGLDKVAMDHAAEAGLSKTEIKKLRQLGVLVNYNGYGARIEDLHYAPDELYRLLNKYDCPLGVVGDTASVYSTLQLGYQQDIAAALRCEMIESDDVICAVLLDNAPWARRISGTYGNKLASENPDQAIVIATHNADNTLTISLRAPKSNLQGAGVICSAFVTGGGRAGAAGVNALPREQLGVFIHKVCSYYEVGS